MKLIMCKKLIRELDFIAGIEVLSLQFILYGNGLDWDWDFTMNFIYISWMLSLAGVHANGSLGGLVHRLSASLPLSCRYICNTHICAPCIFGALANNFCFFPSPKLCLIFRIWNWYKRKVFENLRNLMNMMLGPRKLTSNGGMSHARKLPNLLHISNLWNVCSCCMNILIE